MTHQTGRPTLALIACIAFAVALAPAARAQEGGRCSRATVAGTWGFTTNGTVVHIGPRSSLGLFTLDAAGNIENGRATASLNGSVTEEKFHGAYTVKPDCTVSVAIDIFDLSGNKLLSATLNGVFDDGVRELRLIFTSVALPDGTALATVITGDARKLSK